ncbi:hypothetical protein BpHYR1_018430 [Brachionus plicatilis]|uniref:Uncharacterized protein n=1 Tax=Brachionus plicatilis TaxID=10195 RepID=A0A3M7PJ55_BRAPC|nr:hypothetical protein BpHYR1_018430 [Brachionus plicatilis]
MNQIKCLFINKVGCYQLRNMSINYNSVQFYHHNLNKTFEFLLYILSKRFIYSKNVILIDILLSFFGSTLTNIFTIFGPRSRRFLHNMLFGKKNPKNKTKRIHFLL